MVHRWFRIMRSTEFVAAALLLWASIGQSETLTASQARTHEGVSLRSSGSGLIR
jgi:hypothetical protein